MYFMVASFCVLTAHVTVCVCHAELKDYLLTYLLTVTYLFFMLIVSFILYCISANERSEWMGLCVCLCVRSEPVNQTV